MPTGYTADIIDGKIKTFPEFAKLCMRAFGALVHMRDEQLHTEYQPRVPSEYHTEHLKRIDNLVNEIKTLSDDAVVAKRRAELLIDKAYHLEAIENNKVTSDNLRKFLSAAEAYVPPTTDHYGIKAFMMEQLQSTIEHDCNDRYHTEKLADIEIELQSLSAESIRQSVLANATKELRYHQDEYDKDVQRCEESNKWVKQFIESL